MIKKIYDRDTGNIYDVGADNKLKLVAEGTYDSENSTDFIIEYNLDKDLAENKFYYIERYDDTDGSKSGVFIRTGSEIHTGNQIYTLVSPVRTIITGVNSDDDSIVECSIQYSRTKNMATGVYTHKKISINSINRIPITQSESDTLQVYELPFSL